MKRLLHTVSVAASILITIGSCQSSSSDQESESRPSIAPIDTPSYNLGYRHGLELLKECGTENETRDRLLDLRARHHIINTQIGQSAGRAYELGVEQAIIDSGDTLANIF